MNPVGLEATSSTKPRDSSDAEQRILVSKLFNAISSHDNRAAIRLAPKIHRLDDYTDPRYGETPLLAAARYDASVECMQILLPLSDPLRRGFQKTTALILAAHGASPHSAELVRLLLPVSDPLATRIDGTTALHCAIFSKQEEIVALLLPHSDLQHRSSSGRSILDHAKSFNTSLANLVLGEMARREALEIAKLAPLEPASKAGSSMRL